MTPLRNLMHDRSVKKNPQYAYVRRHDEDGNKRRNSIYRVSQARTDEHGRSLRSYARIGNHDLAKDRFVGVDKRINHATGHSARQSREQVPHNSTDSKTCEPNLGKRVKKGNKHRVNGSIQRVPHEFNTASSKAHSLAIDEGPRSITRRSALADSTTSISTEPRAVRFVKDVHVVEVEYDSDTSLRSPESSLE